MTILPMKSYDRRVEVHVPDASSEEMTWVLYNTHLHEVAAHAAAREALGKGFHCVQVRTVVSFNAEDNGLSPTPQYA